MGMSISRSHDEKLKSVLKILIASFDAFGKDHIV